MRWWWSCLAGMVYCITVYQNQLHAPAKEEKSIKLKLFLKNQFFNVHCTL